MVLAGPSQDQLLQDLSTGKITVDQFKSMSSGLTAKIDRTPMECPGFHVELSGWRGLWQLDKCIEAVYGGGQ